MNFRLPPEFEKAAAPHGLMAGVAESDTDSDIDQAEALTLEMEDRPIEAVLEDINYLAEAGHTQLALDKISAVIQRPGIEQDHVIYNFLSEYRRSLQVDSNNLPTLSPVVNDPDPEPTSERIVSPVMTPRLFG